MSRSFFNGGTTPRPPDARRAFALALPPARFASRRRWRSGSLRSLRRAPPPRASWQFPAPLGRGTRFARKSGLRLERQPRACWPPNNRIPAENPSMNADLGALCRHGRGSGGKVSGTPERLSPRRRPTKSPVTVFEVPLPHAPPRRRAPRSTWPLAVISSSSLGIEVLVQRVTVTPVVKVHDFSGERRPSRRRQFFMSIFELSWLAGRRFSLCTRRGGCRTCSVRQTGCRRPSRLPIP